MLDQNQFSPSEGENINIKFTDRTEQVRDEVFEARLAEAVKFLRESNYNLEGRDIMEVALSIVDGFDRPLVNLEEFMKYLSTRKVLTQEEREQRRLDFKASVEKFTSGNTLMRNVAKKRGEAHRAFKGVLNSKGHKVSDGVAESWLKKVMLTDSTIHMFNSLVDYRPFELGVAEQAIKFLSRSTKVYAVNAPIFFHQGKHYQTHKGIFTLAELKKAVSALGDDMMAVFTVYPVGEGEHAGKVQLIFCIVSALTEDAAQEPDPDMLEIVSSPAEQDFISRLQAQRYPNVATGR